MTRTPRVTVLLPTFNAARYLAEAVAGILSQSFQDFELLVLDDGSEDDTPRVLGRFSDPRLRIVEFSRNRGHIAALNDGLELARGELIARQDADDRSAPDRLAQQVAAMDAEPEIVLLGTAYRIIDHSGRSIGYGAPPEHDVDIRWQLSFQNAFAHSTVMFRREALLANHLRYEQHWYPAEDYRLWTQLSRVGSLRNLPGHLVDIRRHPHQISEFAHDEQRRLTFEVARGHQQQVGISLDSEASATLCGWEMRRLDNVDLRTMEHLRMVPKLIDRFAEELAVSAADRRRLEKRWVDHLIARMGVRNAVALWRSGLAAELVRIDPLAVGVGLAREASRRLLRRLRTGRGL